MLKVLQTKFKTLSVLLLMFICCASLSVRAEAAANPWVSVRSQNFFLVGHLSEGEAQALSNSLEEFRTVFVQLLPENYFDSQRAGTILVFAADSDYSPFKPLHEGRIDQSVAGYFSPGSDLSYITLAARDNQEDTTSVLFHEYVHSLIRNSSARAVPLWYNEGLAEYYSAYDLLDGGSRVRYGKSLARHVQYLPQHLRRNALLPLSSLLDANRSSALYNDQSKRYLFYAQSWALVHYLLSDQSGERGRQLTHYLKLTGEGRTNDNAIREAFHLEPAALESRLAAYVRAGRYPEQEKVLAKSTTRATEAPLPQLHILTEAESEAQLGDLLFRTDRFEEAHQYLERALKLDANLASARITLALLYLREGHPAEAKAQLQAAISAAPLNYLAHYYYADLLRRDCADAENTPAGFVARTALIKGEINEAIKLAPDFADAYGLLVLTNIERSPQLDEATQLLERLLSQSPANRELRLLQVQLEIRQEKFTEARRLLQPLLDDPQIGETLHLAAQEVFDDLLTKEKISQARQAENEGETAAPATGEWQPCDMPEPGPQFKSLRFAGRQTCGRLEKVECENEGITLFVKAGERTLRLHTIALNNIRFVTYTKEISGRIQCGVRQNPDAVLVTYQQTQHHSQTFDGELKAVEFVPEDWLQEK